MPNPVMHWEISAEDPKKIQEFYGSLFDWQIDANNPYNYGLVDTKAEGINGGIGGTEGGGKRITFYVQVDDLQAYLDKAVGLGAQVLMPPTEIPGAVTMALFADPEGNVTGLIKGMGEH
ncbi:MAG: VOC family protein [Chloroflexi bacterium]|nr:VOC family protein [Chloroflexota bacterium]